MGFLRKVAAEYVELCGNKSGGDRKSESSNRTLTLDEIAKQLGTSRSTLTELLEIERKLTPERKELIDDGVSVKVPKDKNT